MSKELTEQWREGTLPTGHYYCKLYISNFEPRIQECVKSAYSQKSCIPMSCGREVEEVLGPVPDYMDCKGLIYDSINLANARKRIDELVSKTDKLEKKLAIATKGLKVYANKDKWHYCSEDIEYFYTTKDGWYDAEQSLKEMEGVK